MKVLQTNLDRTRAAYDVVDLITREKDIDVTIMCEPNIKITREKGHIIDNRNDVSVHIRNKNIGITNVERNEGYIKIEMTALDMYCCYFSPNRPFQSFKVYIDEIMEVVKAKDKDAIILGDLNSKSAYWGSQVTDNRGRLLEEWIAEMDLVVINTGLRPTFERGTSASYIDVTLATRT